jgi:hypothetical protein
MGASFTARVPAILFIPILEEEERLSQDILRSKNILPAKFVVVWVFLSRRAIK